MNQMTETVEMIDDGVMTGMTDDDDEAPSSPESAYNDGDLMHVKMEDEVTAQLAAAGPVGVAAAAAIASAKKRKRPHSFETNPSIRKRQQNRLLRKLSVSCSSRFIFIADINFVSIFSIQYLNSLPVLVNKLLYLLQPQENRIPATKCLVPSHLKML